MKLLYFRYLRFQLNPSAELTLAKNCNLADSELGSLATRLHIDVELHCSQSIIQKK